MALILGLLKKELRARPLTLGTFSPFYGSTWSPETAAVKLVPSQAGDQAVGRGGLRGARTQQDTMCPHSSGLPPETTDAHVPVDSGPAGRGTGGKVVRCFRENDITAQHWTHGHSRTTTGPLAVLASTISTARTEVGKSPKADEDRTREPVLSFPLRVAAVMAWGLLLTSHP